MRVSAGAERSQSLSGCETTKGKNVKGPHTSRPGEKREAQVLCSLKPHAPQCPPPTSQLQATAPTFPGLSFETKDN